MPYSRRTALKCFGVTALGIGTTTSSIAAADPGSEQGGKKDKGSIRKMGHSLLSDPVGAFAEESIRSDGQYAVVGGFLGPGGSFLVDISNPTDPTEVHQLPSPSVGTRHADVKFDHRDGLYYRSLEGENEGVEVIDYGFLDASPAAPEIVATMDAGGTHNLFAHPEEPIVYTVNEHHTDNPGIEVWDVSDPTDPQFHDDVGPPGALHDIVIDPERNLAHGAYISDAFGYDPTTEFAGYLIWDVSDPWNPVEEGRFDYEGRPAYTESRLENGEPGFEHCHYANYDPERGIAIVGDELASDAPGGKHVFDIGWGSGSPSDPQHIGFTYSPNAELMDVPSEAFDWTGHNFDIIPKGSNTLLVSGDYHEGAAVYDISDPTDPTPTDVYETDDKADVVEENGTGPLFPVGDPPMAWGVDYADQRDFTVVSDMVTGLYVLKFTPSAAEE